jgi:hypothetical protein
MNDAPALQVKTLVTIARAEGLAGGVTGFAAQANLA